MSTKITRRRRARAPGVAIATASILILAACGGGGSDERVAGRPTKLGENESKVSILAWPGYVEDGTNDPEVDWVTPFEEETGCEVTSKSYGTSDEAFNLAKTGDYDVIAASGDLTAAHGGVEGGRRGQHRPASRTTRRSSTSSRTRSGTPSTASTTASRTATAPTC